MKVQQSRFSDDSRHKEKKIRAERERILLDGESVELLDREQESNCEDSRIVFQ